MNKIELENIDLENICIEKDIMVSITKELGSKVSKILQKNYIKDVDNREEKIAKGISDIEIKKAIILESRR